jgi:Cytochrome P460
MGVRGALYITGRLDVKFFAKRGGLVLAAVVAIGVGVAVPSLPSQAMPPFGGPADMSYATELWQKLVTSRLVGPDTIISYPYKGKPPHGKYLEFLKSKVTVQGHTGAVLVKKNYGGKNIDDDDILANHRKFLKSITVMFKRDAGYDPKDKDWFWVKYAPNGSVLKNPKGMSLAGRVAKGKSQGCIACHSVAPGNDFIYNTVKVN